jgi:hypothetical protein
MAEMIKLTCENCGQEYVKSAKIYNQDKKHTKHTFCSCKCSAQYKNRLSKTQLVCAQCRVKFNRANSRIKKGKHCFCSRYCKGQWEYIHLLPKLKYQ